MQVQNLAPALLVVGPPDSGKSVVSHAIFQTLLKDFPNIYLQRANWDGEGNWILEAPFSPDDQEVHKLQNKGALTDHFFAYHAQAILKLRRQQDLVIVDVGGKLDPQKDPILEACSHYIIVSSDPTQIGLWHEFCRDRGNLMPVAVIHSVLQSCLEIQQEEPYPIIKCGPWERGASKQLPEVLTRSIQQLMSSLPRSLPGK